MSKISLEDVEYVAQLAQLALDDATKERLLQEMTHILGYIDKLSELDTEGVAPMMHAMEMTNVFREDEVGPSLAREAVLRLAPDHDDEYFLVPKILETGDA